MRPVKDAGDWYTAKREEADRILALIRELKEKDPKNLKLLENLEEQLEYARYVGD